MPQQVPINWVIITTNSTIDTSRNTHKARITNIYQPSAFLTCSASSLCSESINSSIRFSQVACGLSNQRRNISWQQMTGPFNLCACSASMCLTFCPFGSRSIRYPTCFQSGAMVLIISTLSPLDVLILISCAILGSAKQNTNTSRSNYKTEHIMLIYNPWHSSYAIALDTFFYN